MSRRTINNSWYVYIAKAKTGRYYTGITTSPNERIIKHNSGKGSRLVKRKEIKTNKWNLEVKLQNPLGIRTHD